MASIYALEDPRTGSVRYIGKTVRVRVRLYQHLSVARTGRARGALQLWINELQEMALTPVFRVVTEVPDSRAEQEEKNIIEEYRKRGVALLNATDMNKEKSQLVAVSKKTHRVLTKLARQRGCSMKEIVDEAVYNYWADDIHGGVLS